MCCSMRATVFFLASLHMWFAVTQTVVILNTLIASFSDKTTEAVLAVIFAVVFPTSGYIIFRGADKESATLVGVGSVLMIMALGFRYTVMYLGVLLMGTLPEGDFLNPYGVTVPVIFTVLLYVFYLSILFCYHNELKFQNQSCLTSSMNCQRHYPPTPDTPPT